jgi:hypothetical protein
MKDLYLSEWQNHIDEDREQQPPVVLQLGRGRGASRLLVRAAERSEQQGVAGWWRRWLLAPAIAPLYMVVTCGEQVSC